MTQKYKKYNEPDASLNDIMREDARMADKARDLADKAQLMGWIAIGLSLLSIVLSGIRLLLL